MRKLTKDDAWSLLVEGYGSGIFACAVEWAVSNGFAAQLALPANRQALADHIKAKLDDELDKLEAAVGAAEDRNASPDEIAQIFIDSARDFGRRMAREVFTN